MAAPLSISAVCGKGPLKISKHGIEISKHHIDFASQMICEFCLEVEGSGLQGCVGGGGSIVGGRIGFFTLLY